MIRRRSTIRREDSKKDDSSEAPKTGAHSYDKPPLLHPRSNYSNRENSCNSLHGQGIQSNIRESNLISFNQQQESNHELSEDRRKSSISNPYKNVVFDDGLRRHSDGDELRRLSSLTLSCIESNRSLSIVFKSIQLRTKHKNRQKMVKRMIVGVVLLVVLCLLIVIGWKTGFVKTSWSKMSLSSKFPPPTLPPSLKQKNQTLPYESIVSRSSSPVMAAPSSSPRSHNSSQSTGPQPKQEQAWNQSTGTSGRPMLQVPVSIRPTIKLQKSTNPTHEPRSSSVTPTRFLPRSRQPSIMKLSNKPSGLSPSGSPMTSPSSLPTKLPTHSISNKPTWNSVSRPISGTPSRYPLLVVTKRPTAPTIVVSTSSPVSPCRITAAVSCVDSSRQLTPCDAMQVFGCTSIKVLYKFKVCNIHSLSSVRLMSVVTKVLNGTKLEVAGLSSNMTLTALQCREAGVNVTIANVCSYGNFDWASLWVSATCLPSINVNCTAFNRLNVTLRSSQAAMISPSGFPRSRSPTQLPVRKPSRRPSKRPSLYRVSTTAPKMKKRAFDL